MNRARDAPTTRPCGSRYCRRPALAEITGGRSVVDRVDDLACIYPLEVDRRDPEVRMPSCLWIIGNGIASCAISIA